MTFKEIYTEVQDVTDDESSESLLRIKRFINRGQELLVSKLPPGALTGLIAKQTGTTTDDVNEYDVLPTDFVRPHAVVLTKDTTDYACRSISIAQVATVTHSNNPTARKFGPYYYWYGTTLGFSPDIDDAYAYAIWYIKETSDLSVDSNIPIFPKDLHNLLVEYAVARYFEREQDGQASYHRELFNIGLAEAVNFYGQYNQPTFISPPEVESEV